MEHISLPGPRRREQSAQASSTSSGTGEETFPLCPEVRGHLSGSSAFPREARSTSRETLMMEK
eukprot:CAMPEP_0184690256 /NCGR_PEP_ID=MMETSP0312-20130426/31120_1 /TAXON_ID=31354 /ORGANISM="Compsopogon coeruleus, Strain SAG 36.94" /LENGTH=62 /DNA_ID=CAMNT_0027147717 /DNA_START=1304 /DNA_END=1489 /DNA_ORIENTATION=-